MRPKKRLKVEFGAAVIPRVRNLQKKLKEKKLDAILVSNRTNRFYLTGWQGDIESGYLLITPEEKFLITDSRYAEHATRESDFSIVETNKGITPVLKKLSKSKNLKTIGFESHDIPIYTYEKLKKSLQRHKLLSTPHLVENLRKIKDESEVLSIKKACSIIDKAFNHIRKFIKVGKREVEVAWEIERYMRENGAQRMAWDPFIVATGKNASMAHWGASRKKIKKGEMVQIDYGCLWSGYSSDMSRVLFMGTPTKKQREVYKLVLEAQMYGLSLVKSGVEASEIDKKVFIYIERMLPSWLKPDYIYKHSLGHGVGIDVHELPYVSIRRKNRLEEGNVITVEPGIYIPGWGGVRIEDTLLVTKSGFSLLTKSSKDIGDSILN